MRERERGREGGREGGRENQFSILCVSHCSLTGWLWKRRGDMSMPSRTTPEGGVAPATAAKVGKRSTVAAICEREGGSKRQE